MTSWFRTFLLIALVILLAWLFSPWFFKYVSQMPAFGRGVDPSKVGEAFGILSTLFTGLALAAIVVAIWIQTEQLRKQDEELALYKSEIERSALRFSKEEKLSLLKLKMEVVPQICKRREYELRQILDWEISEHLSESPSAIMALTDRLAERQRVLIQQRSMIIDFKDEASTEKEREEARIRQLSDEEKKELLEAIQNGTHKPKALKNPKDYDHQLVKLESELQNLLVADKLLQEIRRLQRDLDATYLDATAVSDGQQR